MSFFEFIKTPTFLINEAVAKKNIQVMVDKAKLNQIRFRPHFKTHQSAKIGNWYLDAGVRCITVSSVTMANYFAAAGWKDILIAFPVNILEINEINLLAQRVKLGLLIDSVIVFDAINNALESKVDLWIKIDTGYHRSGLFWENFEDIIFLAKKINSSKKMKLKGLLTHAGHTYQAKSPQEILEIFSQTRFRLLAVKKKIQESLDTSIEISVGDTPGCKISEDFLGIDEIRPGNFIFYDVQQYCLGVCSLSEIAAMLACPVVSVYPERNEALIYGGAIHLSKDIAVCSNGNKVYGLVHIPGKKFDDDVQQSYVRSISQEHGIIHMPSQKLSLLSPGKLVLVYPTHSCLTLQAMQDCYQLDGERIQTMLSK